MQKSGWASMTVISNLSPGSFRTMVPTLHDEKHCCGMLWAPNSKRLRFRLKLNRNLARQRDDLGLWPAQVLKSKGSGWPPSLKAFETSNLIGWNWNVQCTCDKKNPWLTKPMVDFCQPSSFMSSKWLRAVGSPRFLRSQVWHTRSYGHDLLLKQGGSYSFRIGRPSAQRILRGEGGGCWNLNFIAHAASKTPCVPPLL